MLNDSRLSRGAAMIAAGLLLSSCAETNLAVHALKSMGRAGDDATPSGPGYKVGKPYQVNGVWYYPAENDRYVTTGVASWYGDAFHGRRTANGDTFDKMSLTAAHPTLPMPSAVRVTNLQNGRSLDLTVNDRGPFVGGRVIDVSQRAAQLLGFEQDGTTPVRVAVLPEESQKLKLAMLKTDKGATEIAAKPIPVAAVQVAELAPPPPPAQITTSVTVRELASKPVVLARQAPAPAAKPAPSIQTAAAPARPVAAPASAKPSQAASGVFVQAGAFLSKDNADALRRKLARVAEANVSPAEQGDRTWYRVRLGPVASKEEAEILRRQVAQAGVADARLVSTPR